MCNRSSGGSISRNGDLDVDVMAKSDWSASFVMGKVFSVAALRETTSMYAEACV